MPSNEDQAREVAEHIVIASDAILSLGVAEDAIKYQVGPDGVAIHVWRLETTPVQFAIFPGPLPSQIAGLILAELVKLEAQMPGMSDEDLVAMATRCNRERYLSSVRAILQPMPPRGDA